ncbi:MAG: hypothetical protein V2A62_00780 [Candidatus Woesearchaeota archaeon]
MVAIHSDSRVRIHVLERRLTGGDYLNVYFQYHDFDPGNFGVGSFCSGSELIYGMTKEKTDGRLNIRDVDLINPVLFPGIGPDEHAPGKFHPRTVEEWDPKNRYPILCKGLDRAFYHPATEVLGEGTIADLGERIRTVAGYNRFEKGIRDLATALKKLDKILG